MKGTVTGPEKISCSDPSINFVQRKREQGYVATQKNSEVCERDNDAVIISVKPQQVPDVCRDIMAVKSDSLVISVAAGVTLQTLESNLPGRRVVRVMPNTACLVGESASGFALGSLTRSGDKSIVERIFGSVGLAIELKEELLNAVTGLSGSGPAYVFQFIEALADGKFLEICSSFFVDLTHRLDRCFYFNSLRWRTRGLVAQRRTEIGCSNCQRCCRDGT